MKLGTDPEFFIIDTKTERPVSAHKFLGDKQGKTPLTFGVDSAKEYDTYGSNGKIFRDGYVVEVNVDPHHCRGVIIAGVANSLGRLLRQIGPGYRIDTAPARKIDLAELQGAPMDLMSFGCDPAWNAYTLQESASPLDASSWPIRYAGGHMHFGITNTVEKNSPLAKEENYPLLAKMMDLWVALPIAFLTSDPRTFERREFYGKAGEFRIQKYGGPNVGFEYRVPGSDLYNHHFLVQLAFGAARHIITHFNPLVEKWNPKLEPKIQKAVNTGKDLESLLGTVPGFYTPEILRDARERYRAEFRKFSLPIPDGKALALISGGALELAAYGGMPGRSFFQYAGWTNEVVHRHNGSLKKLVPWDPVLAPQQLPALPA